jgi:hypothetical protein
VAVKNDRIRVYLLEDVGTDGTVDMQYVRQPSTASDEGYWCGFAYISGRETSVGAQAEHVVTYDAVMDDHVPIYNTSDAVITRLGAGDDEVQQYKVLSVGHLRDTGEKIARCLDVSDAAYTLTSN